jgi:DNA-binding NtrC family response regulator
MKSKTNILIVDDHINQCNTMAFILERKGYSVTTAGDGVQAIALVEKNTFDIIFMDIKMPIMNGVQAYKRIKKISPGTKVIMMTAYAVEDLVQEALQVGAYGIIHKPLDIKKVLSIINKSLEDKQGALIMVVDDDPSTCATLKNILIKKNYKVGTVNSGEEAIAAAKEKTFDIIFIDMKLPTLNGLETYLAIKKTNPGAVAVMMTAYRQEMSALVDEAMRNNAYSCLYKPFNISEMLDLIAEIIARKQAIKVGK